MVKTNITALPTEMLHHKGPVSPHHYPKVPSPYSLNSLFTGKYKSVHYPNLFFYISEMFLNYKLSLEVEGCNSLERAMEDSGQDWDLSKKGKRAKTTFLERGK